MNDYNYVNYNYYTGNNQDNAQYSLNQKQGDYKVVNDEPISNTEKSDISKIISKLNIKLRNKYATR